MSLLQVGMAVLPMRTRQLAINNTNQTLIIRNIVILVLTFQVAPDDDDPSTMMIHLMTVVHGTMIIPLITIVPLTTIAIQIGRAHV